MKRGRLGELEKRARALTDGRQLVTAVFADGTRRRLPLPGCIPLLRDGAVPALTDIDGDAPEGSGILLELLRGLIEQPENENDG